MDLAGDLGHLVSDAAAAPGGQIAGPTVLRITLGGTLRRLREQAGVSREAAAEAVRGSEAKISRMELGRVGFKQRDIADLLTLFGVTDPAERDEFLRLARRSTQPGWWHRYSDLLPHWFETYLDLEQAASVIRIFELQFMPGLLQTPQYAKAVTELAHPRTEQISRRVELRMQQQQLLTRTDPPTLWAIIDEAVLRRSVSDDPAVLRAQLGHLRAMNERTNVVLQFVPLRHTTRPTVSGSFTHLRFAQPDLPDIVYLEQLTSALYLDKRNDVNTYAMMLDRLAGRLEPPNRAAETINRILAEIG